MMGNTQMSDANSTETILDVQNLTKFFPVEKGFLRKNVGQVRAVDDVSFTIQTGETVGLVGESGCGKTTTGYTILRGYDATSGHVYFKLDDTDKPRVDITTADDKALRLFRRDAQMIFQDPYASLDPRMTVMDIVSEPLVVNKIARGSELKDRLEELLDVVGLDKRYLKRYPHAFSGGQRQRIGIARALSTNPRFIVADEPTSALDVSIQAQILNLMRDLQEEFHLTYLLISHDLSVVEHMADRVAILYLGKLVEMGPSEEIFSNPLHPYTEALLKSVPVADPRIKSGLDSAPGEVGSAINPPSGCYFHPRCAYAKDQCKSEQPVLSPVHGTHGAACHFADSLQLRGVQRRVDKKERNR
jgi:peptide/nickel transport system ATP-binding protein